MSKVWLITGSSRGLGRNVAEAALAAGDQVVATARKPEQLQDLVDRYSERVRAVQLDVTNAIAASGAVQMAITAFGRLDVVVNNAGYAETAAVEDVTLDSFRAHIDTNFFGVVYMTKAVLPVLRRQGSGHIIQVSSAGGRIASPGLSAYQSAKWAVGGFSTALAQEVAPLGIRVTIVEPGNMRTNWVELSMTFPPVTEPYKQTVGAFAQWIRTHAGQEPNDPTKVARLILQVVDIAEPPVRLLVGSDAIAYAADAERALVASDEKWRELSESVGYEAYSGLTPTLASHD